MGTPSDGWVSQLISSAKAAIDSTFGPRTIKLLLLAILALAAPLLQGHGPLGADVRIGPASVNSIIRSALAVTGVALMLAAIASGLFELRTHSGEASVPAARASSAVLGARLVLGLDVGRGYISYGALRINDRDLQQRYPLAGIWFDEVVPTQMRALKPGESRVGLYEQLVVSVRDLLLRLDREQEKVVVNGIAISTPSWIDIRAKSLASPVGPFPANEALVVGLARRLWEGERPLVRRLFALPKGPIETVQDLESCIFLDTDSRSAVRYDLHQRLRNGIEWNNYAGILVVEGVGAGLVLNGEVYYGSHSSEGEVGHTTVHLSQEYQVPGSAGPPLRADEYQCDCQLSGMHWETLSSTNGLLRIAAAVDPARFLGLETTYGRRLRGHDLIDVACLARHNEVSEAVPGELATRVAADRPGYQTYCTAVFREYARILTIGIANLANVLDLDHVVIGGSMMKELDRVSFRNDVRMYWADYVVRGQSVGHSFKSLKQIWQGAALLFWDPSYHREVRRVLGN